MANTLHGPFVKGASLTAGSYGTGVGQVNTYTSGNANNDETQSAVALNSFNGDLLSAFVLSGVTCTKDGTTASQLDVASGHAYLTQSDGSLTRCDVASTTFSTTGNPSTTMYLDLNPDGSWSWATSHSGITNHLTIASVTTDGSGNISAVTDARVTMTTLLPNMTGGLSLPNGLMIGGTFTFGPPVSGHYSVLQFVSGSYNYVEYGSPQTGPANFHLFAGWNGSAETLPFGVGSAASGVTKSWVNDGGGFGAVGNQTTAGSFGVPVIVAQALDTHVTATTLQTILSYTTGATGMYRVNLHASMGNASAASILAQVAYTDPHLGGPSGNFYYAHSGVLLNGGTSIGPSISIMTYPMTIWASSGTAITVYYTDGGGTPNDYVSVIIERLS